MYIFVHTHTQTHAFKTGIISMIHTIYYHWGIAFVPFIHSRLRNMLFIRTWVCVGVYIFPYEQKLRHTHKRKWLILYVWMDRQANITRRFSVFFFFFSDEIFLNNLARVLCTHIWKGHWRYFNFFFSRENFIVCVRKTWSNCLPILFFACHAKTKIKCVTRFLTSFKRHFGARNVCSCQGNKSNLLCLVSICG